MFEAPEPFKAVESVGHRRGCEKDGVRAARDAADARRMPRAKLLKVMDMNDGTIAENAAEVAAKNAAVAS